MSTEEIEKKKKQIQRTSIQNLWGLHFQGGEFIGVRDNGTSQQRSCPLSLHLFFFLSASSPSPTQKPAGWITQWRNERRTWHFNGRANRQEEKGEKERGRVIERECVQSLAVLFLSLFI